MSENNTQTPAQEKPRRSDCGGNGACNGGLF